ncbi:MAG TPA: response regulator transcription factor [Bacteroidales bacterium]|nr:response regulator transcription factor [Bacteroidales bacterium]
MYMPLNISIVDDHELFRDGLKLVVNQIFPDALISEASNGQEYLSKIRNQIPDITLMDINMPVLNGRETTKQALELFPDLKIIAVTMFGEENYCMQMIESGVKGIILKKSGKYELDKAIHEVLDGGSYFSQEIMKKMAMRINRNKAGKEQYLSERELEVLVKVCNGLSNNEIGDKLFISPKTVEVHKSNIFKKTGVKNSAQLVIYAIRNGYIEI